MHEISSSATKHLNPLDTYQLPKWRLGLPLAETGSNT